MIRRIFQRGLLLIIPFLLTQGVYSQASSDTCSMPLLASVRFKKGSVFLSASAKATLDSVVKLADKYCRCKIEVTGYATSCELCMQVSWDKVFSVVKYLTNKGVDRERILFMYGLEGDIYQVDLKATMDEGPSSVPAPVPCFSFHKLTPRRCTKFDGTHAIPVF
jgi:hypothetical protein